MCQGCWSTSQTRPQKIHRSKSFCHYKRTAKFWLDQFSGKSRSWGPGGMGLPTRSSPKQMPRPYEVAKFSLFQFFTGLEKQERLGKILPLEPDKILGRRKRDWADTRLSWFWHHWDRLVRICVIIWFWESFMKKKGQKTFGFPQGSWGTLTLLALESTAWVLNLEELRCTF